MKRNEFRKAIDAVQPDAYLKTRLGAKIAAPRKKSPKRVVLGVTASALCVVVAVTAFTLGGTPNKPTDPRNRFVMCVNAAEPEEEKNYTPLDRERIILSNQKLSWEEQEGGLVLAQDGEYKNDFTVSGENITYVTYTCKTGSLVIDDINMSDYLYQNNLMFDIIVPKAVGDEMHLDRLSSKEIDKLIKNGVFDKYFGDKKPAKNGYYAFWQIFEADNLPYCKEGYGLVSNETIDKIYPTGNWTDNDQDMKEYTFQNVMHYTENIAYSGWLPDISELEWDGKNHFDDIPPDVLTVEVTYEDGTKQKAAYRLSYTADGDLIIDPQ